MEVPRWVWIGVAALVSVLAIVLLIRRYKAKQQTVDPPPNPVIRDVAAPPSSAPSRSDRIVASLINNLNADMRSLEIGRWFFARLRAQALAQWGNAGIKCSDDYFKLEAIAAAVPGANEVTAAATVKALRALVDEAKRAQCGGGAAMGEVPREAFLKTLDQFQASALAPGRGVLLGMNGYSEKSRLPLPS